MPDFRDMPDYRTTIDFRSMIVDRACRLSPPRHMVLAGAHDPSLAGLLADAASRHGATLHAAAPRGADWLPALRARAGDAFIVHAAPPQDVIRLLPVPALCWVDADPNWFTVHAILQSLAAQAARLGKPFPLTIVQNTGWPYGRRDGYDDPAAIPAAMRHPHEQAGLLPGQSAPAGAAGLHADRYNASAENEPRNGVLTAVEDFLDGRADELAFTLLPGFGGLAAIYPRAGGLGDMFGPAALADYSRAMAVSLENARIDLAVRLQQQHAAVSRAESLSQTLRAALPDLRAAADHADAERQHADEARQQAEAALQHAVSARQHADAQTQRAEAAARRAQAANRNLRAELDVCQSALNRPQGLRAHVKAELKARLAAALPPRSPAGTRVPAWLIPAASRVKQIINGRLSNHHANGGVTPQKEEQQEETALGILGSSPLFDAGWYLTTYPDVGDSGLDPALHYLRYGAAELRDPGPQFSTIDYLDANADVAAAKLNPLLHYVVSGAGEGRSPAPGRREENQDGLPSGASVRGD